MKRVRVHMMTKTKIIRMRTSSHMKRLSEIDNPGARNYVKLIVNSTNERSLWDTVNMYKYSFIYIYLSINIILNHSKCEEQKSSSADRANNVNGSTTVSVTVTHAPDSSVQSSTHQEAPVNSHTNYRPVTFPGSKLPSWDYVRHGSDWTHGMCSAGYKQSPVDLHVEGLKDDGPSNLKSVYDSVLRGETPDLSTNAWKRGDIVLRSPNVFRLTVPQNEGSTFGALFTTDKPNLYVATHIDFHSPSEHTFDGSANRRQIEMQIWHYLSDAPSSDLGIGSLDVPETTEVNMLITKSVKNTTAAGGPPEHNLFKHSSANTSWQGQTPLPNQGNTHTVFTSTVPNLSGSHNSADLSHLNLKTAEGSTGSFPLLSLHSGKPASAKGPEPEHDHEPDFEDEHDTELYYESDDHGPSMVQLTQKVASSDDQHPLNSNKSSSYKKLLENDRFDLFSKYLLTHLNNSANNLSSEQMHIREKKMARQKNTHWGRWAVISLTFMSEEIEKTNIESLRNFPSERFMNEVFRAGSSVNVTESHDYPSVGALNSNRSDDPLPVVDVDVPLNLSSLFMMLEVKNVNYFAYDGSFTQPGCEETVRWYVAKESLPISTELMLQIHRMLNPNPHESNPNNYVDNYRELQNVNNKCRNVGKVRFIHGYPMEYFVISPFSRALTKVSRFKAAKMSLILALSLLLISI
ncbi:uncharacterized protein TOT_020000405 [Theileria orientalis strain Shintoku]|uniref:Alpha-carbonic anhydrase domain-containing protein n=1 Tax=Theileria orientalis strain Shintoku TaxID=869250 RepID=J4CCX3_THEOR|nr:uncharacterized protein TOT_020000405 [Theileria orientalis strain Shintoku]BAM40142.1 uncharacterized protein TOT_020000405 [Theileria orientalis strain Shintoku]|eukprot:XP_009690443.1 uncharacterized protein TOT_020000405 [Theileria orientalis strain Shintoku]